MKKNINDLENCEIENFGNRYFYQLLAFRYHSRQTKNIYLRRHNSNRYCLHLNELLRVQHQSDECETSNDSTDIFECEIPVYTDLLPSM